MRSAFLIIFVNEVSFSCQQFIMVNHSEDVHVIQILASIINTQVYVVKNS